MESCGCQDNFQVFNHPLNPILHPQLQASKAASSRCVSHSTQAIPNTRALLALAAIQSAH